MRPPAPETVLENPTLLALKLGARHRDGTARGLSLHARATMLGPQDGQRAGCHAEILA